MGQMIRRDNSYSLSYWNIWNIEGIKMDNDDDVVVEEDVAGLLDGWILEDEKNH